jgi:hypothetical protein
MQSEADWVAQRIHISVVTLTFAAIMIFVRCLI